jgi:hypothetical protein
MGGNGRTQWLLTSYHSKPARKGGGFAKKSNPYYAWLRQALAVVLVAENKKSKKVEFSGPELVQIIQSVWVFVNLPVKGTAKGMLKDAAGKVVAPARNTLEQGVLNGHDTGLSWLKVVKGTEEKSKHFVLDVKAAEALAKDCPDKPIIAETK